MRAISSGAAPMAEGPGRPSDRARPALLRMLEHAPHSGGLALRIRIVDGTSDGTGHGTGHGTGTGTGAERADRISSRAAPAGPEPPASTDGETIVLAGVVAFVPPMMGKAKGSSSARELFAKNRGINLLAAARVALFGARDVWFVVGVPVFLYASGWTFTMVGAFLAAWTIGYGVVQAAAPAIVARSEDGLSREVPAARRWSGLLALVPAALAVLVVLEVQPLEWIVVAGLGIFGFALAINSSVHSYLVLAYAGSEKAAEDVGFYYAANALGRFFGTLMSGLLYQWGGLAWSLAGSAALLAACWLVTLWLPTVARTPAVTGGPSTRATS